MKEQIISFEIAKLAKEVGYKFNTYEEVLEEGLKESLKLIKNDI